MMAPKTLTPVPTKTRTATLTRTSTNFAYVKSLKKKELEELPGATTPGETQQLGRAGLRPFRPSACGAH